MLPPTINVMASLQWNRRKTVHIENSYLFNQATITQMIGKGHTYGAECLH